MKIIAYKTLKTINKMLSLLKNFLLKLVDNSNAQDYNVLVKTRLLWKAFKGVHVTD